MPTALIENTAHLSRPCLRPAEGQQGVSHLFLLQIVVPETE